MTLRIDRRSLILTGALGLAALAIPGFAWAEGTATGFTHAVASGEPGPGTMLLWTRYVTADGGPAKVIAEVSATPDFAKIVAGGQAITGAWRDHTVKITVAGLKPGTRYFYRFIGPDGARSPVGRTKTLPQGNTDNFKIAVFSCSNIAFGYFNAYAHAAARGDIDLAVHLGDYIYEYAPGIYPTTNAQIAARLPQPMAECIHLADYRLRYASYRLDPDLQALHAALPMLIQWDDHEFANDVWEGGAQNHQPAEGDWNARKMAAIQAWREWMPVSEEPWATYEVPGLATFFRTESRALARTKSPELDAVFKGADPQTALIAFRDGAWQDPAATMLGTTQEAWLADQLKRSVKSGARWQVVGFGTILGDARAAPDSVSWLKPGSFPYLVQRTEIAAAAAKVGMPMEYDNWGGYPAARARFLRSAQAADANLVVLSGDSHNGWAFDLAQDGKPAGVEFAGQAVSSSGYESAFAADPAIVAAALIKASPELKWCDTGRRGYMALTLTPDRASNDWVFVDTVQSRSAAASPGHTAVVRPGRNVMA
jgi:alkaline phosphatase D